MTRSDGPVDYSDTALKEAVERPSVGYDEGDDRDLRLELIVSIPRQSAKEP